MSNEISNHTSRRKRPPKYGLHKATGQARTTVNGQTVYLGKHGSDESLERYERVLAEWRAGQSSPQPAPLPKSADDILVVELVVKYLEHAKGYYRNADGSPTSEVKNVTNAVKPVKNLYGRTLVRDFGPLALEAVRQSLIDAKRARTSINRDINRIRGMFKWAVSKELCPPSVLQSLQAVAGLRQGRTEAVEPDPVKPVSRAAVDAILPHVSRQIRAMIEIQWRTGMRPGEVLEMQPCEIDTTGDVWIYQPSQHKTAWRGHERKVYLHQPVQEILKPFMDRKPESYLFSPDEAEAERQAERFGKVGTDRKTPVYPSELRQRKRRKAERDKRKNSRNRKPREKYDVQVYGRAIARACKVAGIEAWSPNQIRHTYGTDARKQFGIEGSQVALGHKRCDVTQVYSERDERLALEVSRAMAERDGGNKSTARKAG